MPFPGGREREGEREEEGEREGGREGGRERERERERERGSEREKERVNFRLWKTRVYMYIHVRTSDDIGSVVFTFALFVVQCQVDWHVATGEVILNTDLIEGMRH